MLDGQIVVAHGGASSISLDQNRGEFAGSVDLGVSIDVWLTIETSFQLPSQIEGGKPETVEQRIDDAPLLGEQRQPQMFGQYRGVIVIAGEIGRSDQSFSCLLCQFLWIHVLFGSVTENLSVVISTSSLRDDGPRSPCHVDFLAAMSSMYYMVPKGASQGYTTQLLHGVLAMCLLSVIEEEASYGYEMVSKLRARGLDLTSEGSIYPLLSRLQKQGLIEGYLVQSTEGPARKYYRMSDTGRETLSQWKREWHNFSASVESVLEGAEK